LSRDLRRTEPSSFLAACGCSQFNLWPTTCRGVFAGCSSALATAAPATVLAVAALPPALVPTLPSPPSAPTLLAAVASTLTSATTLAASVSFAFFLAAAAAAGGAPLLLSPTLAPLSASGWSGVPPISPPGARGLWQRPWVSALAVWRPFPFASAFSFLIAILILSPRIWRRRCCYHR